MKAFEVNFDGLAGPTYNFSGLSFGNLSSKGSRAKPANPQLAAKQGLAKMKALHDKGFIQGVLPPQERPDIHTLRRLGFSGSDAQVLYHANKQAPKIFEACCSASSMWTANAATISPSADTLDRCVHFTPANLANQFHRSIEHETFARVLQATFPSERYFKHHQALPSIEHFGDEGAANHMRLCTDYSDSGVEVFVYGRHAFTDQLPAPRQFPARQTKEASQAIARLHQLSNSQVIFVQQNPQAIDQGVVHNDFMAVANRNVLLCHASAYLDQEDFKSRLTHAFKDQPLYIIEITAEQLSIQQAVKSQLFNSQLLSLDNDQMMLLVPSECQQNTQVWQLLQQILAADNPIQKIEVLSLDQSMFNGGGPSGLRLPVVLTEQELAAVNPATLMSDQLFTTLNQWIDKHYRDRLLLEDLADPNLLYESRTALGELTQILNLGPIYPFQR